MRTAFKRGVAVLAVFASLVGTGWGQNSNRMKITWANYQIEPTAADAEMLKYYGEKFGVDFEVININNEKYHEILNIKIASGEIPDLFYLKDASLLGTYVKQGVTAKIPMDLLQKNAPEMLKVINDNTPGAMEMGKNNGALYGIPAMNPTNRFHIPLVYRGDWMKAVGVTKVPTTLAEFETLMYKFANNDPDGNGKKDTYGLSQDGLNAVFGAFGLVPFDHSSKGGPGTDYWQLENGKIVNSSVSPSVKSALTYLAKWYKDGVIDPEFITGENQGGYWALSHAFIKGRIGFSTRGNYYHWSMPGQYKMLNSETGLKEDAAPGAIAKEFLAANPNGKIVFGNSLKGPTGKQGMKEYNALMNFYVISKKVEKDPAKMAKILQMLNESANPDWKKRVTVSNGFEGTHWKVVDEENEVFTYLPPFDKDTGFVSRIGAVLKITLPYPPKDPREQWAFSMQYDKFGIQSLIQVGLPMASKYKADLMKLRDESYIYIITGAKPISYFDEYVKKWYEMGGKAATDEANAYYQEQSKK